MPNESPAVTVDPEVQGGAPCFAGTRVPVRCLFDALRHGRTLDYFLENFSSVTRGQARAVLELSQRLVSDAAGEHAAAGAAA